MERRSELERLVVDRHGRINRRQYGSFDGICDTTCAYNSWGNCRNGSACSYKIHADYRRKLTDIQRKNFDIFIHNHIINTTTTYFERPVASIRTHEQTNKTKTQQNFSVDQIIYISFSLALYGAMTTVIGYACIKFI